jgi:hypothetical protein
MAKKKIVPPPPSPVRLQALSLDTKSDKTLGYNSDIIDEVGAGEEADSGVMQKHYAQKDANFFDPYEDYVDRKTLHGGQFDIEELNTIRATNQSNWEQAGHAVARVATNIVPQIISGFASMVDLPGYIDAEHAASNKIVNWAMDLKKEVDEDWFPIYEEKPGQSMSLSDPAWWMSRGSGLVESVGSFLAQGFGVGKVVSLGAKGIGSVLQGKKLFAALEAIPGVTSGANVAKRIGGATQSLTTAAMLNQSEAVIEATQVFNDTYKARLDEGWDYAKAKKAAAEAASTTMNLNRINILLNLSSATAFLKGQKYTRQLLKNPTLGHTSKELVKEGSQEAVEELINHVASKAGMAKGAEKNYTFENALNDIHSMEGLEAAFLGAIGGIAQTGGTKALEYSKYGPGSTTDESGVKISKVQDARNRYQQQQEVINELKDKGVKITDALNSVKEQLVFEEKLNAAYASGNVEEVKTLHAQMFENVAAKHFSAGTTEVLENLLKAESQKDPEEVGQDYIDRAKQAVKDLRTLENIYNNAEEYANVDEVYRNRASKLRAEKVVPEATTLQKESEFQLNQEVDAIAKKHMFDRERQVLIKKNGVVVDTETKTEKAPITYSLSDLENNTGDTDANKAVYEKFLAEVKALPSYESTNFYTEQLDALQKQIRDLDKDYKNITSDAYQKTAKAKAAEKTKVEQLTKDLPKVSTISEVEKMKESTTDKDFHKAADAKIEEIKKSNDAQAKQKKTQATVAELNTRIEKATEEELEGLLEEINNAELSQTHKTNLRNAYDRRASILNGTPVAVSPEEENPLGAFGFTNNNPNDTAEEIKREEESRATNLPKDLPNPKTETKDVEQQVADTATKLLETDTTRVTGQDTQGNLTYAYGKSTEGHNSGAVLSREFTQTENGGIVTREESTDDIENLQVLDPEVLQSGTPLIMEVDTDYIGPKYDPSSSTRETTSWVDRLAVLKAKAEQQGIPLTQLKEYIAEVPIKVTMEDGTTVFYVHDNAWFREENLDNTPDAIAQDKANNFKIREQIIKKGKVTTKVSYKSFGHLFRAYDGSKITTSEAMPDSDLALSVCKNESLDFTKGKLLPTTLQEGRTYAIVPVGPDTYLPVPLERAPITQEIVDSIMIAVEAHLSGDTENPVVQAIGNSNLGLDITTTEGLNKYVQQFIYLYPTEKQEGIENLLINQGGSKSTLSSSRPIIAITATGIEFGKPGVQMGSFTNQDGVKVQSFAVVLSKNFKKDAKTTKGLAALRAILESGNILSHTRLENLQKNLDSVILLDNQGATRTIKYSQQVKDSTVTNLRSINIGTEEAPKYVYTIQPTIKFDVAFAKLDKVKKASSTTKKKVTVPKVTVTPVATKTTIPVTTTVAVLQPNDLQLNVSATTKKAGMDSITKQDSSIESFDENKFIRVTKANADDVNGKYYAIDNGVLRIRINGKDAVSGRTGGATQISVKVPVGFNEKVFAEKLKNISHKDGVTTDKAVQQVVNDVRKAIIEAQSTSATTSTIEAKKADIERRRQTGTNVRGTTYKGETTEKDELKVTKYSEFFPDGKRISKGGRIMLPAEFIEEYNITDQDYLDSLEGATEIRIYEVRVGKDGRSGISIQGTFPEGNIETDVAGTELTALSETRDDIEAQKADVERRTTKVISSEIVEKGNRKGQTRTVTQTNSIKDVEGTIVSVTEYEAKVGDTTITLGGKSMTVKEFKEEFPLDEDYEEIFASWPDLNDDTIITVRKVKRTPTNSRYKTVVNIFNPVLGGEMDITIKKDDTKYDAELAALKQPVAGKQVQIDDIERRQRVADIITSQFELGVELPKILETLAEQGYVEKINNSAFFKQSVGRDAIVFNIDGAIVPIYRSSEGTSSKTKGKWYPFFFNAGDWLVKGMADSYKDGYNNPIIKQILNSLNTNYTYDKPIAKVNGNNKEVLVLLGLEGFDEENNGIYDYQNYLAASIVLKDWQSKLGNIDVSGYQEYLDGALSGLIKANPTLKSEIESAFKTASDSFAELAALEQSTSVVKTQKTELEKVEQVKDVVINGEKYSYYPLAVSQSSGASVLIANKKSILISDDYGNISELETAEEKITENDITAGNIFYMTVEKGVPRIVSIEESLPELGNENGLRTYSMRITSYDAGGSKEIESGIGDLGKIKSLESSIGKSDLSKKELASELNKLGVKKLKVKQGLIVPTIPSITNQGNFEEDNTIELPNDLKIDAAITFTSSNVFQKTFKSITTAIVASKLQFTKPGRFITKEGTLTKEGEEILKKLTSTASPKNLRELDALISSNLDKQLWENEKENSINSIVLDAITQNKKVANSLLSTGRVKFNSEYSNAFVATRETIRAKNKENIQQSFNNIPSLKELNSPALEQTTEQVIANSPIPSAEQQVEEAIDPETIIEQEAIQMLADHTIEEINGFLDNINIGLITEEDLQGQSLEQVKQAINRAKEIHKKNSEKKTTFQFPGKKSITVDGNTKDSTDISEDTFDYLISPLNEEQVDELNAEVEAMIIRGVDSETQRSLIAYISAEIIQKTLAEKEVGGARTVKVKDIMDTNKEYFIALAEYYKENGLPNKAKRLEAVVEQFDKVDRLVQQYMSLLTTGTVTSKPKTESEESVGLEKTLYTDDWAFTIDSKSTASGDLKKFFANIQAQDKDGLKQNSLGLEEIMPFDAVYDTLHEILANKPADYTTMMEILKLYAENFPWINSVVESIEKAPERIKNEFVSDMAKHHIEMSFVMWERNKNGTYNLQRWSSNSASKENRLRAMWQSNLRGVGTSSNIVVVNDEDEYVFDHVVVDRLITQAEKFAEDPSVVTNDDIANWLGQLGIVLADDTYDDLRNGLFNNKGKKTFNQLFTHSQGLFKVLTAKLKTISNGRPKPGKPNTNLVDNANLMTDSVVKALAKLDATNSLNTSSNSFQSGGKTVYSYGNNNYLVNRMRDLTAHNGEKFINEELIKHLQDTSFTKDSLWLKDITSTDALGEAARRELGLNYLSLEALKKKFTPSQDDRKLNNLTPAEHEVIKLGLFLNNSGQTIGKETRRSVQFFYPTMSDKTTMLSITALARELTLEEGVISKDNIKLLFDALVQPEINRIRDKQASDIKGYEPNYFYFLPALNTHPITINGKEKTVLDFVKDKDDSIYSQEFKDQVEAKIKETYEQLVEDKLKDWKTLGIGKTVKDNKGRVSEQYMFLNSSYMADVAKGIGEAKVKYAAMDYIFNSLIANSESFKLFAGDPALYAKFKKDKTLQQNLEETFINIGKRLAGDIAPGIELANSTNNKYLQVFLEDKELNSNNVNDSVQLEYFSKIMKDYKKNYSGIEGSDAQEYTTWQEHIYVMKQLGRITDNQFEVFNRKLTAQTDKAAKGIPLSKADKLTYEELGLVMQPIKPVYVGNIAVTDDNVDRRIYIKSSSFPLIPELTAGLQIEKVRKAIEKFEKEVGGNISSDGNPAFVRASFGTANKVGAVKNAVKLFDDNGNVNDNLEIKEENSLVLNRSNFRIQQDVPYKREKNEINVGSQEMKLLFVNLLDVQIDENHTGEQLLTSYNQAYKELYEYANEKLAERLGLVTETTSTPELVSLLETPTTTAVADTHALKESLKGKSTVQNVIAKQKFSEEKGENTIDRVKFIDKNFDKIVASLLKDEQIKVLFQDENNQNKKCE